MSMHKVPLTPTEDVGLRAHGLDTRNPSQLSDAFRFGVAWGLNAALRACEDERLGEIIENSDQAYENAITHCLSGIRRLVPHADT
jgi:hypothetical protein